jgi:hypothetical protein
MLPAEGAVAFVHEQRGRLARGALAIVTTSFATTMRTWILLLNVAERVSIARRRKACVLVTADSPAELTCGGITVTVTGLAPREG